jgi:putative hydrolase of the HAD superfamily
MIQHLLFDLDDTLYPASAAIHQRMTERMMQYVSDYLGLSMEETAKKRREGLKTYGATLEWLQNEYHFDDPDDFLSSVHPDTELEEIPFDPKLRPFLISLNLPMTVLTNGPLDHAQRVLEHLKVEDLFKDIWDINRNNYLGKPHGIAYLNALNAGGYTLENTVFFDDSPLYIEGYLKLGGKAVQVSPQEDKLRLPPGTPRINSVYEIEKLLAQDF